MPLFHPAPLLSRWPPLPSPPSACSWSCSWVLGMQFGARSGGKLGGQHDPVSWTLLLKLRASLTVSAWKPNPGSATIYQASRAASLGGSRWTALPLLRTNNSPPGPARKETFVCFYQSHLFKAWKWMRWSRARTQESGENPNLRRESGACPATDSRRGEHVRKSAHSVECSRMRTEEVPWSWQISIVTWQNPYHWVLVAEARLKRAEE